MRIRCPRLSRDAVWWYVLLDMLEHTHTHSGTKVRVRNMGCIPAACRRQVHQPASTSLGRPGWHHQHEDDVCSGGLMTLVLAVGGPSTPIIRSLDDAQRAAFVVYLEHFNCEAAGCT